jgi:hypothetical protein
LEWSLVPSRKAIDDGVVERNGHWNR